MVTFPLGVNLNACIVLVSKCGGENQKKEPRDTYVGEHVYCNTPDLATVSMQYQPGPVPKCTPVYPAHVNFKINAFFAHTLRKESFQLLDKIL